MKRVLSICLTALILMSLCACGGRKKEKPVDPAWQEQYDLGIRYLSEGNYEEAIIAFTAAIGIDAKQAGAYTALADAYIGAGDYNAARAAVDEGRSACDAEDEFSRWEKVFAFLEAGDPGVMITDVYYDKASYSVGEETEFLVSVVYSCIPEVECALRVGANTEQADAHSLLEDLHSINGSGSVRFPVKLTPAKWEDAPFYLCVELSGRGQSGEWLPISWAKYSLEKPEKSEKKDKSARRGIPTGWEDLSHLLEEDGALTYDDMPEILFLRGNELELVLGQTITDPEGHEVNWEGTHLVEDDRQHAEVPYSLHGRDYSYRTDNNNSVTCNVLTLQNDAIWDMAIHTYPGKQTGSAPAGWRNIRMDDSFETIIEKLGFSREGVEGYNCVHIDLYENRDSSYIHATNNDDGGDRGIFISFHPDPESIYYENGYEVNIWFTEEMELHTVRYMNHDLLLEATT